MDAIDRPARLSRRGLLSAGTAGVAAAALGACSRTPSDNSSGGKTFTLYWNAGHGYETYAKVIKKFEQDHSITVNWQKFQWPDLLTKLQADVSAGTVPDLVEDDGSGWPITFASTGDAMPLDDYIAEHGKKTGFPDDWQPGALRNVKYKGKTYGVPIHLTCNQLFYNKGMLHDAGISEPPGTWDEFLAACHKLTRGNRYGVALNSDASYSWSWYLQDGVTYWNSANRQLLAPEAKAVEAMKFQYDLVHKYKVSPVPVASSDYSGPQKLLSAKRVAMILSGPWDIEPIRKASPDIDLGLGLPLAKAKRATYLAGAGMFIPTKSKHPDLAWDLITRLTDLKTELAATKEVGVSMPRKSWAAAPPVRDDETIGAIAKALAYGTSWQNGVAVTGKADQLVDLWKTSYESAILQGDDPAKAVRTFRTRGAQLVGS